MTSQNQNGDDSMGTLYRQPMGRLVLQGDLTLPSAVDSAKEDELTLTSAAEDNQISLSEEEVPEVPVRPLLTSTPQKGHHDDSHLSYNSQSLRSLTGEDNAADIVTWQLTNVMKFNGCADKCAMKTHGLTDYDVLRGHHYFENKVQREQNDWVIQYFAIHCPYDINGEKEFKNIPFTIQGKRVCVKLWLEVLPLSTSRFYRLRQDFLQFGGITSITKRRRSLSSKTLEAITWMEQYFLRVGDKRPDKADSIYLPKTKLFKIFIEDVYNGDSSHCISRSQFNNLFRKDFKNVLIPKVRVI